MIKNISSQHSKYNDEDNFRAKFITGFAGVGIISLGIGITPYLLSSSGELTVFILSGLIGVLLLSLYLVRIGKVTASSWIIIVLGWLGIGLQAVTADGVKDVIVVAYIALGLLASIVISRRAGSFVILFSILVIVTLAFLENRGIFQAREQDPITYGRDLSFIFITIATLIYISTTGLKDAIQRATKSEEGLRATNLDLQELNQTLEERVAGRTVELEAVNERIARRAHQFEAVAQIAKLIISNQSLEALLPLMVQVTSEKFGFYHAGIFLIDETRAFAVLSSANSIGGKRMMARHHKLGVGQTGIVGYVAATGNPRIVLDVGTDAVFFDNPDLPDTRSEMALPLRVAEQVIGVLDIQSIEPNAFLEEDIEILLILADQVAIAIQNARTFESTQKILESAQISSGSYRQSSWRTLRSQEKHLGYQISSGILRPISKEMDPTMMSRLSSNEKSIVVNGQATSLVMPIRFADINIGVVDIRMPEGYEWDPDEINIAEAVADRLSLALESATLLQSTQRRAEIERITADISGKVSASTQFDAILRTAAEELSRALGGSDVLVQLQADVLDPDQTTHDTNLPITQV